MESSEMMQEALLAVFEAMGFSVAVWIFVTIVLASSVYELWESHKCRKELPSRLAAEICKQLKWQDMPMDE